MDSQYDGIVGGEERQAVGPVREVGHSRCVLGAVSYPGPFQYLLFPASYTPGSKEQLL